MSLNRWSQATVDKKMYFAFLFVFTMVVSTSYSTTVGGHPRIPQTDSDRVIARHIPLQLWEGDINEDGEDDDGFLLLEPSTTPSWVVPPVDARLKISLLFLFSNSIDPTTLGLGHTFKLTLNGEVAEGTWQFNPEIGFLPANYDAVFYANRPTSEIAPLGAGDSLFVSFRMKGTSGPITDVNGNILPFNGVYRAPETESGAAIIPVPFKTEDLLDGDRDGVPGGDFVRGFEIPG